MGAALCRLGVLVSKGTTDVLKNPAMVVCIAMPVGFALFYRFFLGDLATGAGGPVGAEASPEVAGALQHVVLSMALCMAIGMGAAASLIYGLAEEKEKHTLRTLMLANVTAEQIMLSKGLVALVLTAAVEALCFAVSGAPWALFGWYLLFGVMGAVPVILLSLVVGLASRDQMTAGLYSVPVLLLSLAPVFGGFSPDVQAVVRFAPTGGMDELLGLAIGGGLSTPDVAAPIAVTLAWTVAAAVAFKLLYRRLLRDN